MKVNSITDYIKLWNDKTPDKTAYVFLDYINDICYEKKVSYKEFYEKVCLYACYLMRCGVKKGDRVIVIAKQCSEIIYSIYSVLLSRGILVLVPPIEDEEKRKRFEFTVKSSEADYIITDKETKIELVEKYVNCIDTESIEMEIKNKVNQYICEKKLSLDKALEDAAGEMVQAMIFPKIELKDIACLQYTSGSISDPKGVMLSHNNIIEAMKIQQEEYLTEADDINVTWLPYFHTMELTCGIFFNVYTNRKNIFMKTSDFMEKPCRWFEVITKYKATMTIGPISGYMAAVKDLDDNMKIDLSSLRYVISSSEPVQEKESKYVCQKLKKYGLKDNTFYTGLGMTEASTIITIEQGKMRSLLVDIKELENNKIKIYNEPHENSRMLSCAGKISKGIEMKIVNPVTLRECASDEIGEIWIRGGCKACGYWNQEEKTKQTFKANLFPYENTFLRSGDLGYILDNRLYITGRCKDIMIINGHNIYTKDIEYIIKEKIQGLESKIIQAFSICRDNNEHLVVVVEDENDKESYNGLIKQINDNMFKYFNIEAYDVLFIDRNHLPRTDNGKISLKKMKQQYENGTIESIYSLKNNKSYTEITSFTEASLKLKEIFEKILGTECISLNDSFFELGGSSLKVIKLIKEIRENFQVPIKTADILKGSTIGEIEKYINDKKE